MSEAPSSVARHKTAIRRKDLSLPVKCAVVDSLIAPTVTVFDFGCGHGENVDILTAQGIDCRGWDPVFRSHDPLVPADVVNLGYVINVIEDPTERASTLRRAWDLSEKLLVVAAQIKMPGRGRAQVEFGDGVLTGRGTFQKYYTQGELQGYLQAELGTDAIPAAPGVFYLFKDETLAEQFLSSRCRRRPAGPRKRASEIRFEEHRGLLEPFVAMVNELGRLPEPDEFPLAAAVAEEFGSLRRAFAVVCRVMGNDEREAARKRRTEDLLVYLALARFRRRPPISKLPLSLQRDIREFFGSYTRACEQADESLFQAGQTEAIDDACKRSPVGKLLPNALYLHCSALESLEPLLRIYEGCARAYLGTIEDANVVKLHRFSGKVSYLAYPDFDTDPHPALVRSVKLNLRTLEMDCWDYGNSENPPILHRKDTFLDCDHPLYEKFARLTRQEERHGLLDDAATIGTRQGWQRRLAERQVELRGHRVLKRKGTDR